MWRGVPREALERGLGGKALFFAECWNDDLFSFLFQYLPSKQLKSPLRGDLEGLFVNINSVFCLDR